MEQKDKLQDKLSANGSAWHDFAYGMLGLALCGVDFVALLIFSDTAYGIQICTILGYTCLVVMHVFLRGHLGRGYSLKNAAVRLKLPWLAWIHCMFCGTIFMAQTFLMRSWRHLPTALTKEIGPKHDSILSLTIIFLFTCVWMAEVLIVRRILNRAHAGLAAKSAGGTLA